MRHRSLLLVLLGALLLGLVSDTHATGFTYRLVVSVANGSGGTLDDVQVPLLDGSLDGLIDSTFFTGSGYVQADGDDIQFIKGADLFHGFAQDLNLTSSVWWSRIEDLADGDTRDLFINMGNPAATAETADLGVGFFTDADTLTTVDAPSLDVTDDFALEVDVELFDMGAEADALEIVSKHAGSTGYGFAFDVFSSETGWDQEAEWLAGSFDGGAATDGDAITLDPASLGYSSSFGDFFQERVLVDTFDDGDVTDWSNAVDFEATTATFQAGTHAMRLKTDRTGPAETSKSFAVDDPEQALFWLLITDDSPATFASFELRNAGNTVIQVRLIGDGAGAAALENDQFGSFVVRRSNLALNTWHKVYLTDIDYSLSNCRLDVWVNGTRTAPIIPRSPCAANFAFVDEAVFSSEGSAAAEYGAIDSLTVSHSDRDDFDQQAGDFATVVAEDFTSSGQGGIGTSPPFADGLFAIKKVGNAGFPFSAVTRTPDLAVANRTPAKIVFSMYMDNAAGAHFVQVEPDFAQNIHLTNVRFWVGNTIVGNCPANTASSGCFDVSTGGGAVYIGNGEPDDTWYTVTLSNVDFETDTFDIAIEDENGAAVGSLTGLTFTHSIDEIRYLELSGNHASISTNPHMWDNLQTINLSEGTHTTEWRPLVASGSSFAFDTIETVADKPVGTSIELTVETGDDCATAEESNVFVVPDGASIINIGTISPARCIRLSTFFTSDDLSNQPSVARYAVSGTPSEAGAIVALAGSRRLDAAWDGTRGTYRLWYTASGTTTTFALTRDGFHVASDPTVSGPIPANAEHLVANPRRLGVLRDVRVLADVGVLYRNLVTNPSVEVDLSAYAAYPSSTISRDTDTSAFGDASVKLVSDAVESPPVEGFSFDVTGQTVPLASYTASVRCKGEGRWALQFSDDATGPEAFYAEPAVELEEESFTELETGATLLGGSTFRRITVTRAAGTFGDGTQTIFCDGLQVTDGLAAGVAYADGDQGGNAVWSGAAHASVTLVPGEGTPALTLDFEPASMSQTDPGDAGDGWTWESEVFDQSGNLNTTTYEAVFDATGIVAEITGFQILSNAVFTGGAVETEPALASDPVAIGNFASEEEGGGIFVHGLLSDLAASSGLGIQVMWALLMLLVVSVGALWIWRFSGSPFWTMLGCGILVALFPFAGVVPGWTLYVAAFFMLASFLSNRLAF